MQVKKEQDREGESAGEAPASTVHPGGVGSKWVVRRYQRNHALSEQDKSIQLRREADPQLPL
jgi:hypothetical protein